MKKWKTFLALTLLILAIYFDWSWFWAIFILIGLVHVIKSGEIHFVEAVKKKETPKLFWSMVVIWSFLAIYSILNYLDILT
jgi:energy-coupling factor transporter transmembrane protein EcfT